MIGLKICLVVGVALMTSSTNVKATSPDILPRHCGDLVATGQFQSQGVVYSIYPDGHATSGRSVYCERSGPSEAVTIVKHNMESRQHLQGYETPGGHHLTPSYFVTGEQLEALKGTSVRCEQYMKVESKEVSSGDNWLVLQNDQIVRYLDTNNPYYPPCLCIFNDSCSTGNTGCAGFDTTQWGTSEGYLYDSDAMPLPVKTIAVGDTGHSIEEMYVTLGPLRCYHRVPVIKNSHKHCGDLAVAGILQTNTEYIVDPEGLGVSPAYIQCEMSSSSEAVTVVHHNIENRRHVTGYEAMGSYQAHPKYGVTGTQLTALKTSAVRCEQYMKVESKGVSASDNMLLFGSKQVRFVDTNNPYYPPCRCIFNESCTASNTGCAGLDIEVWGTSEGYFYDSESIPLPLSSFFAGDTGLSSEELYYTLGPLRCYHHVTIIQDLELRLDVSRKVSRDTKLTDGSETTCSTFEGRKDVTARVQIKEEARSRDLTVQLLGRDLPTGDISMSGEYQGTVAYVGRYGAVQDFSGEYIACQQTTVTSSSITFRCHCKYGACADVIVRIFTSGGFTNYEICELQVTKS